MDIILELALALVAIVLLYYLGQRWYRRLQNNFGASSERASDYTLAARCYRKAADLGDVLGQRNLGSLYYRGLGVSQDFAQAEYWFHKAAEQGEVSAQYLLGGLYLRDDGGKKDNFQAYFWLTLADEGNCLDPETTGLGAMLMRNKAADLLTPVQIEEAQKLAREWKPKKQGPLQQLF